MASQESLVPKSPPRWLAICLWAVIGLSCFYNLANFPTLWWDEAIFSETAANLTQYGRYALTVQSPDQLQDLDYRISVGPVVIVPVALAYRLFGIGVVSGRVVAASFLVFTLFALYLCARRLVGPTPALVAVGLAWAGTDLLYWGRSVLGDIPALGYFLFGSFLLLQGLSRNRLVYFLLGGVFLGLAIIAKEFYGLTLLPAVLVLSWAYRGQARQLWFGLLALVVGAMLPLLGYLVLKIVILGSLSAALGHFLHQKHLLCHEFFTPFTIGRIYPESFAYLLSNPLLLTGGLGLGWQIKRQGLSVTTLYWLLNLGLWSGFYLMAVYWQRFALPALLLACPFAGYFVVQLAAGLLQRGMTRSHSGWIKILIGVVLVGLIYPLPMEGYLGPILNRVSASPYRLVSYLRAQVPRHYLIETPEYELPFLDDNHRFHLVPEYYFIESTPEEIKLLNPRGRDYDFASVGADLLILGSFGKSVFRQVYPPARISQTYRKIATIDYYDIYLRQDRHLPPPLSTPPCGSKTHSRPGEV